MTLTFREYVRLKETAGDSWGDAPVTPVQIMLGPNAPIAGNLTGAFPPSPDEQYKKYKVRKRKREIHTPPLDDENVIRRNMDRAKELGIDP